MGRDAEQVDQPVAQQVGTGHHGLASLADSLVCANHTKILNVMHTLSLRSLDLSSLHGGFA